MRPLLIAFVCLAPFTQSPKQHTADKHNAQAQINKPSDNQSVPNAVKPPETQFYTYNNQNSDGNENAKQISDYSLAVFTLALVVVSVMQWLVLRKHEEWMQKHDEKLKALGDAATDNAIAARENSQATLLNAKSFINSERPWIVVILRVEKGILTFLASNEGRAPAVIVDCFAQWSIQLNPQSLPVPANYGQAVPNNVPFLVPNYGHDQLGPFVELLTFLYDLQKMNDPSLYGDIEAGNQKLLFWFKIVYTTQMARDAGLAPYETCYCCEYSPTMTGDLRIAGPPEYNKYT